MCPSTLLDCTIIYVPLYSNIHCLNLALHTLKFCMMKHKLFKNEQTFGDAPVLEA